MWTHPCGASVGTFHVNIEEVLEDFDDLASDLVSTSYQLFDSRLKQFLAFLDETEIVSKTLAEKLPYVDFDIWYENAKTTVKGMVGSGHLDWPSSQMESLSMRLSLLRHISEGKEDIPNFCSKFMYSDNNFNVMVQDFAEQIIDPTARDIRKLLERSLLSSASQAVDAIDQGGLLVPHTQQMSEAFENARKTLGDSLANLEGQNDPEEIGLSKEELKIVVGHLRACSEMLKDHMMSKGLLNDTVNQTAPLKDKLGLVAAATNVLSALLKLFT